MRGYGCYGANRKKKGYAYGTSSIKPPSLKEMGSATANPGSEPFETKQMKTNLSDVDGTTQQIPESSVMKYKYKYKYPMDKYKRKYTPGEDDVHMQSRALPGEQYRGGAAIRQPPYKRTRFDDMAEKKPGIEPRSVPGDQYETDASINTNDDQQNSGKKDEKELAEELGLNINIDKFQMGMDDTADLTGKISTFLGVVKYLGGTRVLPGPMVEIFDALQKVADGLAVGSWTASMALPILEHAQKAIGRFSKNRLPQLVGKAREKGQELIDSFSSLFESAQSYSEKQASIGVEPGRGTGVEPKGVGQQPGESRIPGVNVQSLDAGVSVAPRDTLLQGEEPLQAYQGEEQKATGGDPNRVNPITPATGAKQTSATANSLISVKQLKAAAERTSRTLGPEAVHGNARERANMGKGALDTYEFQGPFDYPVYPGGRPDDSLTMMGAWRTDGGNDSSLWYSKKTAKGANAKRNKYFKWSAKAGGRWRKLSKDDMVNVIQKGQQSDNRFYGTRTNLKFSEFQRKRDNSVRLAKIGNTLSVNSNHGYGSHGRDKYVGANMIGRPRGADIPPPYTVGTLNQDSKEGPGENTVGEDHTENTVGEDHTGSILGLGATLAGMGANAYLATHGVNIGPALPV